MEKKLFKSLIKSIKQAGKLQRNECRIWVRIKAKLGFKLTSNERGKLARWITRDVTESCAETLRKVRSGASIED